MLRNVSSSAHSWLPIGRGGPTCHVSQMGRTTSPEPSSPVDTASPSLAWAPGETRAGLGIARARALWHQKREL